MNIPAPIGAEYTSADRRWIYQRRSAMKIPTPIGNENTSGDGNTSANWRWIYHHLAKRLPRTWPDISLWKIHGNLLCKRYVPHYSIPSEEWNWKPNRLYQNLYKYAYVLKLHSINIGPYNATEFEIVKWTKIKDFSHFKKANQNTIGLDMTDRPTDWSVLRMMTYAPLFEAKAAILTTPQNGGGFIKRHSDTSRLRY